MSWATGAVLSLGGRPRRSEESPPPLALPLSLMRRTKNSTLSRPPRPPRPCLHSELIPLLAVGPCRSLSRGSLPPPLPVPAPRGAPRTSSQRYLSPRTYSGSRINPAPVPMLLSASAQCRYLCLLRILLQLKLPTAGATEIKHLVQHVYDSIAQMQRYIYPAASLEDGEETSFAFHCCSAFSPLHLVE
jgi:hypothetical protein